MIAWESMLCLWSNGKISLLYNYVHRTEHKIIRSSQPIVLLCSFYDVMSLLSGFPYYLSLFVLSSQETGLCEPSDPQIFARSIIVGNVTFPTGSILHVFCQQPLGQCRIRGYLWDFLFYVSLWDKNVDSHSPFEVNRFYCE